MELPEDRGAQMQRSLAAAVRRSGLDEPNVRAVTTTHALAMEPRVAVLEDDHHPAYLHPGRSVLVLLQDVGAVDVAVLVVAMLHESVDSALAVAGDTIRASVGDAAVAALASIPLPGDERLVERLVGLGPGVALAALAERLDHLRHLHLRQDLIDTWADTHAEVAAAWLPFAERVHPQLHRRYAHWTRTFVRRI